MPYAYCEQIGKEIRDISDEIPFEIPDSWEWVRLGSIVYNRGQMKPTSDFCYVDIGSIDNKRQRLGDTENIITPDKAPSRAKKIIDVGDIIYSTVRPYLHNMCIIDKQFSLQPIASTGFATMTCYSGLLNKYLFYYLLAPDFDNYANDTENSKGVAYPAINDDRLYKALIPLPPLSEQHRIVAKIEELLPYIERYGKAEEHITALNTTFPEALKKSILQEAVQGKLVPQDPDDEPASVLLERIRVEKQKLIKAGKIKKSKHESVIVTRDKIPYEIPDSWVWCKLSDLAILENGDRSSKYPVEADYVEIGIPFFGAKDIDGDMMSFQNVRFISQQKYDELGNGKLVDGDIICLLRGSVGKTAKFEANEQFDTGFICAQMLIIRLLDKSLFGYISSYFKSPDYTNYVESKVTGTAVRQMPAKEMGNLLIPLPPLAEQHRIVAKIEEIMPMIERLTLR